MTTLSTGISKNTADYQFWTQRIFLTTWHRLHKLNRRWYTSPTGAFVLPQGMDSSELPTLRSVHTHSWYTTYNLLSVIGICFRRDCLERKFPKLRPLASLSGNSMAYFLYLIQLSFASRQELQDLLTREKATLPHPHKLPYSASGVLCSCHGFAM